jgi:hypothetical protein
MKNNAIFYRKIIALIGIALLMAGITRTSRADNERGFADKSKFTKIDVPGAAGVTAPRGINSRGDIVGSYYVVSNNARRSRGFLLSKGTFTNIDVDLPGARGRVDASGINPEGDIVGDYFSSVGVPGIRGIRGFLLRNGTFTKIKVPGASATFPHGINPRGDIVGSYNIAVDPQNFIGHGFLLRKGRLTTIDVVPATLGVGTQALGINPQGHIVGSYADSSGTHGFLLIQGTFTSIDVDLPGAVPGSTTANGINPRGDIVGSYADSSGTHGFLLSKGRFTAIDVPAAFGIGTQASGINPRGDIVGVYFDGSGNTHGFLLSK